MATVHVRTLEECSCREISGHGMLKIDVQFSVLCCGAGRFLQQADFVLVEASKVYAAKRRLRSSGVYEAPRIPVCRFCRRVA